MRFESDDVDLHSASVPVSERFTFLASEVDERFGSVAVTNPTFANSIKDVLFPMVAIEEDAEMDEPVCKN